MEESKRDRLLRGEQVSLSCGEVQDIIVEDVQRIPGMGKRPVFVRFDAASGEATISLANFITRDLSGGGL